MKYQTKTLFDYATLRNYAGHGFKITSLASFTQPDPTKERKFTPKGEAGNEEKLASNLSRSRNRIFELAFCNPWELFVTFTLDSAKYDRHDLGKFKKDLSQFLRDYRKKTGERVKYLLIPEPHQDGAWHMHGFLMGLPLDHLREFHEGERLPDKIRKRLAAGKHVYTWEPYARKFGFADIERVENHEAASKYATKYITKETMHTTAELGAHIFYTSQGLNGAEIVRRDILSDEIDNPDYQNERVTVRWFAPDAREIAESYFDEVHPK
ncbi:MAG: hypothetical protein II955_04440 [Clostridia bacterium]|nr:hypothetical protein [Clostridia bacterium]